MTGRVCVRVCVYISTCGLTLYTVLWLIKPNLWGLICFSFVYLSSSFVYGGYMALEGGREGGEG